MLPTSQANTLLPGGGTRRLATRTRNLVATPLLNLNGRILGVFEVLNKLEGSFTLGPTRSC